MAYSALLNLVTFLLSIQLSVQAQPAVAGRNRLWLWVFFLLIASVVVAWFLGREEQRNAVGPASRTQPQPPKQEPPSAPAEVTRGATVVPPSAPAPTPAADDLTRIEGIGPKIQALLQTNGFRTYADLAQADVAALKQVLVDAGLRIHNPATWPEQAALAATGDWEKLTALQSELSAGRRTAS